MADIKLDHYDLIGYATGTNKTPERVQGSFRAIKPCSIVYGFTLILIRMAMKIEMRATPNHMLGIAKKYDKRKPPKSSYKFNSKRNIYEHLKGNTSMGNNI